MTDVEIDVLPSEGADGALSFEGTKAAVNATIQLEETVAMLKENMDVFFLLVMSFICFCEYTYAIFMCIYIQIEIA